MCAFITLGCWFFVWCVCLLCLIDYWWLWAIVVFCWLWFVVLLLDCFVLGGDVLVWCFGCCVCGVLVVVFW